MPVLGWEGLYDVSSDGRVRSLDRVVQRWRGYHVIPGRILKTQVSNRGYYTVRLKRGARCATMLVHRVVLEAFVSLRPDGMECRHLDGDCRNNSVDNLEWNTHLVNIRDKAAHGTEPTGRARWSAKDSTWQL